MEKNRRKTMNGKDTTKQGKADFFMGRTAFTEV